MANYDSAESGLASHPLFKGCTRLATYFGVPVVPFVMACVGVGSLALIVTIWCWLFLPALIAVMKMITATDDKAFRQWGLYFETTWRNFSRRHWKASSYSPLMFRKRR